MNKMRLREPTHTPDPIMDKARRVMGYVWVSEGITSILHADAVLEVCHMPPGCVIFSFQDECVTMYLRRASGVCELSIKSPYTTGVPFEDNYDSEDALRALLLYNELSVFGRGSIIAGSGTAKYLSTITDLVPGGKDFPSFADAGELARMTREIYKIRPWSKVSESKKVSMTYCELCIGDGVEEDPNTDFWMCIRGRRAPTAEEATAFVKETDPDRAGHVKSVNPIDEATARSCYDFSGESAWPIFGDSE